MGKIKENKAELLIQINNLKQELADQNELLYEKGIKKRKTMLSEIEKTEADAKNTIDYIIKECEKKTGRKLANVSVDYGKLEETIMANINSNYTTTVFPYDSAFTPAWKTELLNLLARASGERWNKIKTHRKIKELIKAY